MQLPQENLRAFFFEAVCASIYTAEKKILTTRSMTMLTFATKNLKLSCLDWRKLSAHPPGFCLGSFESFDRVVVILLLFLFWPHSSSSTNFKLCCYERSIFY